MNGTRSIVPSSPVVTPCLKRLSSRLRADCSWKGVVCEYCAFSFLGQMHWTRSVFTCTISTAAARTVPAMCRTSENLEDNAHVARASTLLLNISTHCKPVRGPSRKQAATRLRTKRASYTVLCSGRSDLRSNAMQVAKTIFGSSCLIASSAVSFSSAAMFICGVQSATIALDREVLL